MSEYLYKKDLLEFLENERIREWRESCRSEDANKARRLAARGVVYKEVIEKIKSGAFDVREMELENKLNQAVEALKTIMYLPSSHPYVRAIADNALQSIKGGESNE